jgi:hypothetical protein
MLALATMLLAVAPQAAKAPAPTPPLVLYGVWKGREIAGDVGVRYPTVTFGDSASTLAYEDSQGLSGAMSVRVESIVVRGHEVRFAVKGAQPRFYRGKWDGKKVSGTFASDGSGRPELGTFELTPVVWDDSPRLPMNLVARRAPPSQTRRSPTLGRVIFDRDDDRDTESETALRILGYRLSRASGAPQALESMIDDYGRNCGDVPQGTPLYGPPSSAADCDRMVAQMSRLAQAVNQALDQAEDHARRGSVLPGVVRDLRSELGIDEGDWDRATERLKSIEAQARSRR